ncbi:MAG TPA: adenylate/guanylate cyclase domain-containing protein, partial [Methylomirabilota bacterium]|nr:adenylate/guanylate cyclase domain-containing protein [Methylomirabilota bacterium]
MPRPPASPDGASFKGRLLVVDDEPANRSLIIDSLRGEGYYIAEAADGLEAFEQMAAKPFDVIILDLEMPGMGGFEVLERMKERRSLRNIPVVIVSGWNDMDSIIHGIRAGAMDHLGKPFNPLLLRSRIDACLERKRWHDQEQAYLDQIREERHKVEQLILNILPAPIAARLQQGETTIADNFSEVTVLFADIVGFTDLSATVPPAEIVSILNEVFTSFDHLAELHGLEKIKTIGDCYMAVSGLPEPRADHAVAAARMALDIQAEIRRFNEDLNLSLQMRVGIHSGPVVAGIIGKNKFIYDLWGDTVNLASRMESHGQPGLIQVTEATFERIKGQFTPKARGSV